MQNSKSLLVEAFEAWLPMAVAIVVLSGLVYVAVQQNYRLSANDPQVQIAEDVASAIASNKAAPESIVPADPTVEVTQSLSAFVAVYSATGTPIGSSVLLDGKLPMLPAGVLETAKTRGENRLTWQPKSGARFAVVVAYFGGKEPGYVLAGRSLKEVEMREGQLTVMSAAAAALALVLTFITVFFLAKRKTQTSGKPGQTEAGGRPQAGT